MGECCEKCKYYRVLEHNFKQGKGFEMSHACVLLSDEYDSSVLEVSPQDMCEMLTEKLATKANCKQVKESINGAEYKE